MQTLRVIQQERLQEVTWGAFLQGAGGKDPFGKFLRRWGLEARTPVDDETAERTRARDVQVVRRKLGRFYRPPIKA